MRGHPVENVESIVPDSQLADWEIDPWMFSDGVINWESSSISTTTLTGYGQLAGTEFSAIKYFRITTASGVKVCEADLYKIWPDRKRQRGMADKPSSSAGRPGRKKGTGVYFGADTPVLNEVVAMIAANRATTCDGAVNEILRKDPSRRVGKSDEAMKRRIRDRYRDLRDGVKSD